MKNCNEMVSSLLERREKYNTEQKRKKKILIRTLTPLCCICLIALAGFGMKKSGFFEKKPVKTFEDAVVPGTKDWYGPDETENDNSNNNQGSNADIIGMVKYNGKTYVQNLSMDANGMKESNIALDKKIGNGEDFEGTYNEDYLNKIYGSYTVDGDRIRITIASEIFTVKDNPDLLCAKLENGAYIILEAEK